MNSMKQRLEWLDAMRGFTMILVVAYHVAQSGFMESEKISASLPFLVLFRMPLFFFVSGFLAYGFGHPKTLLLSLGRKSRYRYFPHSFSFVCSSCCAPNTPSTRVFFVP